VSTLWAEFLAFVALVFAWTAVLLVVITALPDPAVHGPTVFALSVVGVAFAGAVGVGVAAYLAHLMFRDRENR
jgi:hypothetical protein